MARFTQEEKDLVYRVHLLSGKSMADISEMFESFCICMVLSCLEEEDLCIPMIGSMSVKYDGEEISAIGKEAKVNINVNPSKFLKKVIGQIKDGEESDIEKSLENKVKSILKGLAL